MPFKPKILSRGEAIAARNWNAVAENTNTRTTGVQGSGVTVNRANGQTVIDASGAGKGGGGFAPTVWYLGFTAGDLPDNVSITALGRVDDGGIYARNADNTEWVPLNVWLPVV